MKSHIINKSTLKFLNDLSLNNNREWFNTNKSKYLDALQNICEFADGIIFEMNKHDQIENSSGKESIFRIYNDVRFRKDKLPYNPRFAFALQRATKLRRGGYYLNIKPGQSYLACGFFAPNTEDLKRIRSDISNNFSQWKKILNSKGIKENFGELRGEKVTTTPRSFRRDHPAIELLRLKQFILKHEFGDTEVVAENFPKVVKQIFKSVRPYFDYMSEVLTTNIDGEMIV